MIKQVLISEKPDLVSKAIDLLNNGGEDFLWMRAKLVTDIWENCDGKGMEEFLCLGMNQHIENGIARKMDNFIDETGQVFHQYMLTDFEGQDMNYIRRIPFGYKKQEKYSYRAILEKYETPIGVQIMIEAGQCREEKRKYYKEESDKILTVLEKWKENPMKSKRELGVISLCRGR